MANADKHAYHLDVFVFIDRLNEFKRKYGPARVQDLIPSWLRGSALTWWTSKVDDQAKMIPEASNDLDPWINTLIKHFWMNLVIALATFTKSRYSLQDLHRGMSPKTWIYGQLSLLRSAGLSSTYNQLTMI